MKSSTRLITLLVFSFIICTNAFSAHGIQNIDYIDRPYQDDGITIVQDDQGIEMVYVPAGTLEMGLSMEKSIELCLTFEAEEDCLSEHVHTQNIQIIEFWIDRYEVSNEQYDVCIRQDVCDPPLLSENFKDTENIASNQPIVGVSWYQATLFCNWRVARLPTEAEWEWAARGPEGYVVPWGGLRYDEYIKPLQSSMPVGSVEGDVSWVGAHDMAYNVREWTEDRYIPNTGLGTDFVTRSRADIWRVIRGGGWAVALTDAQLFHRAGGPPLTHSPDLGFRCARFSDPRRNHE